MAWLNSALSGRELIESDTDAAGEDHLIDTQAYLGASDTPRFPSSWSALSGFSERFGVKKVCVVAEAA